MNVTNTGKSGSIPDMSASSSGSVSENFSADRQARRPEAVAGKSQVASSADGSGQAKEVRSLNERPSSNLPDTGSDVSDGQKSKKRRRKRRRRRGGANVGHQPSQSSNGAVESGASIGGAKLGNGAADLHNGKAHPNAARPIVHHSNDAYAALDLGTNNCRLLIAVPTKPGSFRVIDAFSRIVRLGEGFGATGRLSDAAMDRAIEALKVCRDKLYARPIQKARLIATEACRSAVNGGDFLLRVEQETGLKLEVVDRETEARLAVSGCSSLVDRSAKSIILFDIGGGSSEIALVNAENHRGGRLANHIRAWTSLPVGVVTMAEKFGGENVTHAKFDDMVDYALNLLHEHGDADLMASSSFGARSVIDDDFHLIGTSGTVTTLAGIHLDLPRYDRRRVDGLWMSSNQVDAINHKLLNWTFAERSANACIGSDRADLVLAGCAILEAIRKAWPSERLRVADRGLREGILTEMMASDGAWRRRNRGYNRNWKSKNRQGPNR
ncbi:Ppx/GppA phosphatase family protein [Ahrensia sp. 13_GOM-1096m]|uniref:Ppx/GppA phosphatase family protein n=1 Tax=Ahrensia sp. 13_GOM-1096m TaxID=1380380 RepID=UPI000A90B4F3|nr:Ppx/GppA phosphatase family protein [Ahrensia sp. 13_GOM-1096m]